ncbi:hypothetical protein HNQ79_004551 [Streptomyces candidus]|uniref:Uncharacterized protein n=1 Tax=Streptomyces candidus TaxID=67283 RepID=A0A7X0HI18_9ACTN|nr:hypothetical protein [Streptomyces candidus]MBB6438047.1 hypothetical protein [Streptomyces candidus]GHH39505.1 hypothetical protein GCM10018773_19500 [Streptomyces candidus]
MVLGLVDGVVSHHFPYGLGKPPVLRKFIEQRGDQRFTYDRGQHFVESTDLTRQFFMDARENAGEGGRLRQGRHDLRATPHLPQEFIGELCVPRLIGDDLECVQKHPLGKVDTGHPATDVTGHRYDRTLFQVDRELQVLVKAVNEDRLTDPGLRLLENRMRHGGNKFWAEENLTVTGQLPHRTVPDGGHTLPIAKAASISGCHDRLIEALLVMPVENTSVRRTSKLQCHTAETFTELSPICV